MELVTHWICKVRVNIVRQRELLLLLPPTLRCSLPFATHRSVTEGMCDCVTHTRQLTHSA
jgi:hypothetical protein